MSDTVRVDEYIANQDGWQKTNLETFRRLVHETLPGAVEAWKWMVPVFTIDGHPICAMSVFKHRTKFNFFDGASLDDTNRVFNNGMESKKHRSIDLGENDTVPTEALRDLLQQVGSDR